MGVVELTLAKAPQGRPQSIWRRVSHYLMVNIAETDLSDKENFDIRRKEDDKNEASKGDECHLDCSAIPPSVLGPGACKNTTVTRQPVGIHRRNPRT